MEPQRPDGADILFVCTGNQCRSPLSAALLSRHLASRQGGLTVSSAGFVSSGVAPPDELLEVAENAGLDLHDHRSRMLSPSAVAGSGLIVAMTRQQLIDLALLAPAEFGRCFTFADVLDRGRRCGRRAAGESIRDWASRLGAGRLRTAVLHLSLGDDVPDPMGRSPKAYRATFETLSAKTTQLSGLISPP